MADKKTDGVADLLGSARIREGIEKKDFKLLVEHLRSEKPIYPLIRSYLADLFDPQKPVGIYAKIVLEGGIAKIFKSGGIAGARAAHKRVTCPIFCTRRNERLLHE